MNDPYLIPGQVCEVWGDINYDTAIKKLKYFVMYVENNAVFAYVSGGMCRLLEPAINYRPIGTEWDSAPDWAVCCTVDKDGSLVFWEDTPFVNIYEKYNQSPKVKRLYFGICPDPTRYQGDAWLDSLRLRPEWAGVKK